MPSNATAEALSGHPLTHRGDGRIGQPDQMEVVGEHGRLRQVGTEMCQYDTRTAPVAAVQLTEPRSKLLCRPPATANSSETG